MDLSLGGRIGTGLAGRRSAGPRRVLLRTLAGLAFLTLSGSIGPSLARGPVDLNKIYDISPPNIFRENVGLVDIMVTNVGVIGNPGFQTDKYSLEWNGGEYLYGAGLWIGAIAADNLPHVSTGLYDFELRPSLDPRDTIYQSYEGAPGGNRPGFSPNRGDDNNDGVPDSDPLNGYDDDHDGIIDNDYSAISQQMLACEYWDYTDQAKNQYPEHYPLHVKIHQEVYGWSTEGANNFVGFDFKIKNDGDQQLKEVYLGFFVDSDVGPKQHPDYWTDDRGAYFGIDTTFTDPSISYTCQQRVSGEQVDCSVQKLHLDICSMWDVPDDGVTAKGGDVDGYIGGMFLGHTTDPFGVTAPSKVQVHTARFFSGSAPYPAGDPTNDAERYDLLSAGTKPTRPTTEPDDYRFCFSAGPFNPLAPGEQLTLQMAFVLGHGESGMVSNAINAQRIYNGKWRDVDDNPATGKDGKETLLCALDPGSPSRWKDHCDSLNPIVRTIKDTWPACDIPDNYVDDDCDCCTPLFSSNAEASSQGLETLVHWVGTVAPPPPGTNLLALNKIASPHTYIVAPPGDRRVTVQWDNLSELTADPIQRKILFTGYRIYRVEGWDRPVGSAGPAPEDWQLIADLSLKPTDGLGKNSRDYLPRYRQSIDSIPPAVQTGAPPPDDKKYYYPIGRYVYRDTLGLKNGMVYFYGVTAYSAWDDTTFTGPDSVMSTKHNELAGRPSATEDNKVVPTWAPAPGNDISKVYVVPNPYIKGRNPAGWDLTPDNADPTGTKIAFVGLPAGDCEIRIYTLAGDMVQTLEKSSSDPGGAVYWNLVSRNGQDVVSGVYIYSARSKSTGKSKVGRFVLVR